MEKLKYEKLKVMQPRTRIKSELTVGKKKKNIPDHSRGSFTVVID